MTIVGPKKAVTPVKTQIASRGTFMGDNVSATLPYMVQRAIEFRETTGPANPFTVTWTNNIVGVSGLFIAELATGSDITFAGASFEYPQGSGVWVPITFGGGSATGFMASGTVEYETDPCSVAVPDGSIGNLRFSWSGTAGVPYGNVALVDGAAGDSIEQTAVNKCSGAPMTPGGGVAMGPTSIRALTTKTSIGYWGDSKGVTFSGAGPLFHSGELNSAFGNTNPIMNLCIPGDRAVDFVASHAIRLQLSSSCTVIADAHLVNDTTNGETFAQITAALTTIKGYAAARQYFQATSAPHTTGAWTNADGSDQVVLASSPLLEQVNNWIRTNGFGAAGVFDVGLLSRLSTNPLLWFANGTPNFFTTGGLHGSAAQNNNLVGAFGAL